MSLFRQAANALIQDYVGYVNSAELTIDFPLGIDELGDAYEYSVPFREFCTIDDVARVIDHLTSLGALRRSTFGPRGGSSRPR